MNKQEQILFDMWNAGASARDIGRRVGIGKDAVYKWVKRLGLPIDRRAAWVDSEEHNPSTEEIAERAFIEREKHFAKRISETEDQTRTRVFKEEQSCRPTSSQSQA